MCAYYTPRLRCANKINPSSQTAMMTTTVYVLAALFVVLTVVVVSVVLAAWHRRRGARHHHHHHPAASIPASSLQPAATQVGSLPWHSDGTAVTFRGLRLQRRIHRVAHSYKVMYTLPRVGGELDAIALDTTTSEVQSTWAQPRLTLRHRLGIWNVMLRQAGAGMGQYEATNVMLPQRLLLAAASPDAGDSAETWPPWTTDEAAARRRDFLMLQSAHSGSEPTTANPLWKQKSFEGGAGFRAAFRETWSSSSYMLPALEVGAGAQETQPVEFERISEAWPPTENPEAYRAIFRMNTSPRPIPFVSAVHAELPWAVVNGQQPGSDAEAGDGGSVAPLLTAGQPTKVWADQVMPRYCAREDTNPCQNTKGLAPNDYIDVPSMATVELELTPASPMVPLLGPQFCMAPMEPQNNADDATTPCASGPIVAVAPKVPFALSVNAWSQSSAQDVTGGFNVPFLLWAHKDSSDTAGDAYGMTLYSLAADLPALPRDAAAKDPSTGDAMPYVLQALVVLEAVAVDSEVRLDVKTRSGGDSAWLSVTVDAANSTPQCPVHVINNIAATEKDKVLATATRAQPLETKYAGVNGMLSLGPLMPRCHAVIPLYLRCTAGTIPTALRVSVNKPMHPVRSWLHVEGCLRPGYEAGLPPTLTTVPGSVGLHALPALPFTLHLAAVPGEQAVAGTEVRVEQPLPRTPAGYATDYGLVLQPAVLFVNNSNAVKVWLELHYADGSFSYLAADTAELTLNQQPQYYTGRVFKPPLGTLQVVAADSLADSDEPPQVIGEEVHMLAGGVTTFATLRLAPGTMPAPPVKLVLHAVVRDPTRLTLPGESRVDPLHPEFAVHVALQGEVTPGEVFLSRA